MTADIRTRSVNLYMLYKKVVLSKTSCVQNIYVSTVLAKPCVETPHAELSRKHFYVGAVWLLTAPLRQNN